MSSLTEFRNRDLEFLLLLIVDRDDPGSESPRHSPPSYQRPSILRSAESRTPIESGADRPHAIKMSAA